MSDDAFRYLRLWFGLSAPVGQKEYLSSGLALMASKYAVEATLVWRFSATVYSPLDFLNPSLAMRAAAFQFDALGDLFITALTLWTLPFLWIALSMSMRRAVDAGLSPWTMLFIVVPAVNLMAILALCILPKVSTKWQEDGEAPSEELDAPQSVDEHSVGAARAFLVSLVAGTAAILLSVLLSVYVVGEYGASLFLGAPLATGASAVYFFDRRHPCSYWSAALVGALAVSFGALSLLVFAVEGAICIAMAIPLLAPLGALGGLLGKAISDAAENSGRQMVAAIVLLPMLSGVDAWLFVPQQRVVVSSIEIDAPPEEVWRRVIEFPELTESPEWFFRLGIAYPQRARIVGNGVGATRYCEFSTGAFVEPITVWDEPNRLAFDVTEQPAPMFELSPYQNVHPPHLDGFLKSERGEFRLIRLPRERTRLEGRTWYSMNIHPNWYWGAWSDQIIARIHLRVLRHIRNVSEQSSIPAGP